MSDRLAAYEEGKKAIRMKKAQMKNNFDFDDVDLEPEFMETGVSRQVGFSDVVQVGSKVVIGAGLGLLAGVATIAVTASVAEIILAGVITKIAGVVGGGAGLSMGLKQLKSTKQRSA